MIQNLKLLFCNTREEANQILYIADRLYQSSSKDYERFFQNVQKESCAKNRIRTKGEEIKAAKRPNKLLNKYCQVCKCTHRNYKFKCNVTINVNDLESIRIF